MGMGERGRCGAGFLAKRVFGGEPLQFGNRIGWLCKTEAPGDVAPRLQCAEQGAEPLDACRAHFRLAFAVLARRLAL